MAFDISRVLMSIKGDMTMIKVNLKINEVNPIVKSSAIEG